METFFNIRYEFDKAQVMESIATRLTKSGGDYICVADGNILANVEQSEDYRNIINGGMFSISDSSWTPLFLKLIYNISRGSYTGSDIFQDLLSKKKYHMAFLGGTEDALIGLNSYLDTIFYPTDKRFFLELPFKTVSEFDYEGIAETLNDKSCDIIWVGLGAPKQETFMNKLRPYLKRGVMIGVGAVFNFYGSQNVKRAPKLIRSFHLEFLYRLLSEPKRQIPKFQNFITTLPKILITELKNKKRKYERFP